MTTDRYRLNLFDSGKPNQISSVDLSERNGAAGKIQHLHIPLLAMDSPPRTATKRRKEIEPDGIDTLTASCYVVNYRPVV